MTGTHQLSIDAQLRLRRGSARFDVWSEDELLVCNAPSLTSLRDLWGAFETVSSETLPAHPTRPPIELRVRHAPVLRIDPSLDPSRVGRWLGVQGRLRPRGVLAACIRALG